MSIKWDESSFTQTAEAILMLNSYAAEKKYSVETIVSMMKNHAKGESQFGKKSTYCGTMGYYVTVYKLGYASVEGYTHGAAASVGPWLVLKYRERIKNILSNSFEEMKRAL